jgi:amidase
MGELVFSTACKLTRLIRDRQLSAVELLEAQIEQINRHNPRIHAICTLDQERARQLARQADEDLAAGRSWGPLHGISMTVKDAFETSGLRTTSGYRPLSNYVPQQDAAAVGRLKTAGAIILGKSSLARLAGDFQSINDLFPSVNNPWNTKTTAGGSSGGSAAAVAAGFSPLELGSDFGGSLRQPAHFCGIYSFKPTDRRVSTRGHIPEVPGMPKCIRQMMTVGCMARSVKDLELCFSRIAGADPLQPDVPPVPLDQPSQRALSSLRIAWMDGVDEIPVASEIRQAIQASAQRLREAGAEVVNWMPTKPSLTTMLQCCDELTAFNNLYAQIPDWRLKRDVAVFMAREATQGEPALRKLYNLSHLIPTLLRPSLKDYFLTLTYRDTFTVELDQALKPWDVWLCPVSATPAFSHRPTGTAINIDGRKVPYILASGGYTMPFAFTGHPVVVIPIGTTQAGLPIGMQLVGKRWREMELLAVAQRIDRVVGCFQPPPGI